MGGDRSEGENSKGVLVVTQRALVTGSSIVVTAHRHNVKSIIVAHKRAINAVSTRW